MAEETPICDFGWKAPPFTLPATDGKTYSLEALRGKNGTLVMFICNHCPYVKAVIDRIVRDADAVGLGIGAVASPSNDAVHYPEDSFEQHAALRRRHIVSAFPISMTRARRSRGPMTRPARPTSSASTPISSCNIVGASMRARTDAAPATVAPRAVRGDEGDCRDRPRPARADAVDRLLDQVEGRLSRRR